MSRFVNIPEPSYDDFASILMSHIQAGLARKKAKEAEQETKDTIAADTDQNVGTFESALNENTNTAVSTIQNNGSQVLAELQASPGQSPSSMTNTQPGGGFKRRGTGTEPGRERD